MLYEVITLVRRARGTPAEHRLKVADLEYEPGTRRLRRGGHALELPLV